MIRAVVQSSSQTAQKFANKFLKLYATQKKTNQESKPGSETKRTPPLPGTSIPSKTNFLDRLCMTASFHHSFPSPYRGPPDQPEHIVKCVLAVCGFNLPVTHLYVAGIRGTGGRKEVQESLPEVI